MKRGSWSVESTIGLVFTIALAVIVAMVLAVIGLTAYAATNVAPEQTIVQKSRPPAMCAACASKPRPASASMPCHAI